MELGVGYLFYFVPDETDHRKNPEIITDHQVNLVKKTTYYQLK